MGEMKLDVYTIRFGDAPWLARCAPTLDAWCARHKLDLHIWTDEAARIKGYPDVKFCEVDMLEAFLESDADQMMYIDADVIVHPNAPAPAFGPGMHARCHARRVNNPYWIPWCLEHYHKHPDDGGNYRNAGIWIIDRASAETLLSVIKPPFIEGIMEQHQLNWWIMLAERKGLKVHDLDRAWHSFPKEWRPAWMFHVYGTTKNKWIRTIDALGLLRPTKRPFAPRATRRPEKKSPWPMFMDRQHLEMLGKVIADIKPTVAMEIGSHHGISTQVFLDALEAGHIKHLHIVEPVVTAELEARIWESGQGGKITMHTKSSWELMQRADFVLIDGDHGWPALADLAACLALQTPTIAMHDTNSLSAGISACWGSEAAAQILKSAVGRKWQEDKESRPGCFTQRGFGWSVLSTKDQACILPQSEPT
jgi:hypothetical protein